MGCEALAEAYKQFDQYPIVFLNNLPRALATDHWVYLS
jgi:hypothetical protein